MHRGSHSCHEASSLVRGTRRRPPRELPSMAAPFPARSADGRVPRGFRHCLRWLCEDATGRSTGETPVPPPVIRGTRRRVLPGRCYRAWAGRRPGWAFLRRAWLFSPRIFWALAGLFTLTTARPPPLDPLWPNQPLPRPSQDAYVSDRFFGTLIDDTSFWRWQCSGSRSRRLVRGWS